MGNPRSLPLPRPPLAPPHPVTSPTPSQVVLVSLGFDITFEKRDSPYWTILGLNLAGLCVGAAATAATTAAAAPTTAISVPPPAPVPADPEAALAVLRWRLSERDREVAELRARVAELELEAASASAARSALSPPPGEVADEE